MSCHHQNFILSGTSSDQDREIALQGEEIGNKRSGILEFYGGAMQDGDPSEQVVPQTTANALPYIPFSHNGMPATFPGIGAPKDSTGTSAKGFASRLAGTSSRGYRP